jgi:hypothetical protein
VIDRSGLVIPQQRVGIGLPRAKGKGTITYRCHTCGENIVRPWEAFFVDDTSGLEWASNIAPADTRKHPSMTTHHDWHMQQRED